MFCKKCGNEIQDETARYCSNCGQAIDEKVDTDGTGNLDGFNWPVHNGNKEVSNRKIWKLVLLLVGILGIFVGFYLSNHAANLYGLEHSIGDQWWFEHGGTTAVIAWVGGGIAFLIGCIL